MTDPQTLIESRDRAYETAYKELAERFPHVTEGHLRSVAAAVVVAVEAEVFPAALMVARDDLNKVAERLKTKAAETSDKSHLGTAAGVHLACFRLIELADQHPAGGEG